MFRTLAFVVVLSGSLSIANQSPAAEKLPAAASWIPDSALVSLHISQPNRLIEQIFDQRVLSRIMGLPQVQAAIEQDERNQGPLSRLKDFQSDQGIQLRGLLEKLVGGGITLAAGPDESFLMIVDAEDADLLHAIHAFLLMIVRGEARAQGDPGRVTSAEYGGVTGWTFGPNEAHAIIGNRLLVSNKPELLQAAIDLREAAVGPSLAASPNYQSAHEAVAEGALATLYANMAVLKHAPGIRDGLKQNDNPLARLLLAPLLTAVGEASWLAAAVRLDDQELVLQFTTDDVAGDAGLTDQFAVPAADQGAMPKLNVPGRIASVSLFRDLHAFYANKDTLFPERTGGIIFFENMMGIFFTGRDLTEEVLAETSPDIRMVVARQQYDETTGTPELQIPGFALVIRLRDPDRFSAIVEEAWQKAIGLINFTRGQQALPGLIIDRPVQGDTKYTTASFSVAEEKDKSAVDVRFNFQPSLATQGEHLILSSTGALTRDLIETLRNEQADAVQPLFGNHSLVDLDGLLLASILDANREALIRQTMVEEGKSRGEAELQWEVMIEVLKHVRHVKIDAGVEGRKSDMTIRIGYELP